MKTFVAIFGGHAVGKSSVVGSLEKNKGLWTLGKYKSGYGDHPTGGADALKMTNEERLEEIKKQWETDTETIMVEGMIINYYKSFMVKYKELAEEFPRRIILVHLYCSLEETYERVKNRSGGKEMNEKRKNNLISKKQCGSRMADKLRNQDWCTLLEYDTTNPKVIPKVSKALKNIIGGTKNGL